MHKSLKIAREKQLENQRKCKHEFTHCFSTFGADQGEICLKCGFVKG